MATEPVKFHHSEMTRVPALDAVPEESLPQKPIIGDEPLNAFETYHWSIKTDLTNWMTFSVDDRMKKAKAYAQKGKDADKRAKILNFIIWYESHHPKGNSNVAAIAFRGLFPKHLNDSA